MLKGKKVQVVDTLEIMGIVTNADGSKTTIFTGDTTTGNLESSVDTIEVNSGIGNVRKFKMFTNKQQSLEVTINSFDMDFLAYKNGVDLDEAPTKVIYMGEPVTVATNSAEVTGATRVLSVSNSAGEPLKIVTATPATLGEVKVAVATGKATLTFMTGYTGNAFVTYEGTVKASKTARRIVLKGGAFPKNMEIIGRSIAYDEATNQIIGDVIVHFYQGVADPSSSLSFQAGTPVEVTTSFDIVVPKLLPDGTANVGQEFGSISLVER